MSPDIIRNLRIKLRKRMKNLDSLDGIYLHDGLIQFWEFLHDSPVFSGILSDLARRFPGKQDVVGNMMLHVNKHLTLGRYSRDAFDKEPGNSAIGYFVLKACVESADHNPEQQIGEFYDRRSAGLWLEHFKRLFLRPVCEYVDEHLEDQRAILFILNRYKFKCEWFQRTQLFGLWEADTTIGEKRLAIHMYEYLHDQGLDFQIEPSAMSVRGKPDMVSAQKPDDPLVADAKIFNPEKGKGPAYIASGFNQVYRYTVSYNEPFGYLIIFNTSGTDLKFALSAQTQSTQFVVHNNKTIFLVTIDISQLETPASKAGPLSSIEITEADLIRVVSEANKQ